MLASCRHVALTLGILLSVSVGAGAADEPRLDASGDPLPEEALHRLGSLRFHNNFSGYIALSPDGKTIALLSRDSIILIDAATGKETGKVTLEKAPTTIQSLTYSPNGKVLAATAIPGVYLFDAKTGQTIAALNTKERVGVNTPTISFSADGSRIALGTQAPGAKVTVWDGDGKKLHDLDVVQDNTASVSLTGDGKLLATWGTGRGGPRNPENARTVQLWDTTTGKEVKKILVDGSQLSAAALTPDGKQLATLESGPTLCIRDVESEKILHKLALRRMTSGLRYSPDGKLLAATTLDGAVQVWEAPEYTRLGVGAGPVVAGLVVRAPSLAFLPNKTVRAVSVSWQTVAVWDTPGKLLTPEGGHSAALTAVQFSADGKKLFSGGSDGVVIWDVATGKSERRLDLRDPQDTLGAFRQAPQIIIAPGGRSALVASANSNSLRLVDLATDQELLGVNVPPDYGVTLGAFSADGKTVLMVQQGAVKGANRTYALRLVDVAGGREKAVINNVPGGNIGFSPVVSPDGKFVLTTTNASGAGVGGGQGANVVLWDVAAGKEKWTVQEKLWGSQVAYSPDGQLVATTGQATVHLLDAATGTEVRSFDNADKSPISCIQFSPDGRTLATGSHNRDNKGVVRLWEVATGKLRGEFTGHRQAVAALAFSPDGKTLASASQDTTVLLWDLTGKLNAAVQSQGKPKTEEFDALWKELEDADAAKANRVLQQLAAHPAEAVALVKAKQSSLGKGVTDKEIDKLIADLDNEDFDRREAASKALAALGNAATAALTKALQGNPSAEKKKRIEELLESMKTKGQNMELVRATRALELLERVATPEAKQVLEELAKGDAPLTRQAKETLKRLSAPPPSLP
jgi:WD40 repeat protein